MSQCVKGKDGNPPGDEKNQCSGLLEGKGGEATAPQSKSKGKGRGDRSKRGQKKVGGKVNLKILGEANYR